MRIKIFFFLVAVVLASSIIGILSNTSLVAQNSSLPIAEAELAAVATVSAVAPTDGLVAHWTFDATDKSSPSDYDNSNNSVITKKNGDPKITKGVKSKAVSFNGSEDFLYAKSATPDTLSPQQITAAVWFRLSTTTKPMYLFNKIRNSAEDDGGYALQYVPGEMKASIRLLSANKRVTVSGNANLKEGRWYHAAMVFNGKTLGLYLNGKSIGSMTLPEKDTIEQTDKNLYIGSSRSISNDDKYRFFGDIDELRIYNRALSRNEITALYKSSDTEPPTIEFRSAEMSGIFSGTEKIPVVAKDNAQVASLELYIDGVNIRDRNNINDDNLHDSFLWDSTAVADGRHQVEVAARDILGNTATATARVAVVNTPELSVNIADPISPVMVLPTTSPLPGIKAGTIQISAVKGEYEPASFILRSDTKSFENISAVPSPLIKGGSSVINIPANEVDVKIVKVWYQGEGAWTHYRDHSLLAKDQMLVPELLLNDDSLVVSQEDGKKNMVKISQPGEPLKYFHVNPDFPNSSAASTPPPYSKEEFSVKDSPVFVPFNLPKNTTKQMWLTVHVPENTEPGVYRGNVSLSSNGVLVRKVPIELTVLPFDFSGKPPIFNLYYSGKLKDVSKCICGHEKDEVQMRAELTDFKKHGVNPSISSKYITDKDRTLFERELALRKDLRMNDKPLYYFLPHIGQSESLVIRRHEREFRYPSPEEMKRDVPSLLNKVKSYGFPDLYFYGVDEAHAAEMKKEIPSWKAAQEVGAKIFVSGYGDAYKVAGDILDVLVHSGRPMREYGDKWHNSGKKIVSYNNPQVGPENPHTFRRNYGVVLWSQNYDGAMAFAYQGTAVVWADTEPSLPKQVPGRRDYGFTYPTMDGVIDTIAWEGYREAHDDFKYLRTLEDVINKNKDSVEPEKRDAVANAKAFLISLRNEIDQKSGTGKRTANFVIDLNAVREKVIGHILAITK